MAEPHCYGSLQVCYIRVSLLTSGGAPDDGASNAYVSDQMIKVGVQTELKTGADLELDNGCGSTCMSYKDCDRVKRANLTMDLCVLDAELLSLLVPGTTFSSGGDTTGWMTPGTDDSCPPGVCFEAWTKAWDTNQQATPPFLGGSTDAWWHWVFPKVTWQVGDVTLENDIMTFPLTGIAQENANITANGPFNDWPTEITNAGGITKTYGFFLDDAVPTPACGFAAVPSGS